MIIILLLLFNSVASNSKFLLRYRLDVGAPISVLDGLVFLGIVVALIPLGKNRMPTSQVHPLLLRVLALFTLATLAGAFASLLSSDDDPYYFFTTLRNFLMVPASCFIGYFLTQWPKHARRYALWLVVSGIGAGLMVMIFYKTKAETGVRQDVDINALRTMEYGPAIAGIIATFLIFQIVSGYRMFPLVVTILLAAVAFIGQSATLSRSDWVALAMSIGAIYFLIPREARRGKTIKVMLAAPLIVLFIWVGMEGASRVLGIDFQKRMVQRLETMLPGERVGKTAKAWDSRLGSQIRELQLWAKSPIIGNGFGHRRIYGINGEDMSGYGHNTWTFTLFQTGPAGFAAQAMVVGGMWLIGRRLIRDARGDKTFILIGALGACAGVFFLFHGLTTASFNALRPAIFMGLIFGIVVRTRQMQLQTLDDLAIQQYVLEQQQMLEEQGYAYDEQIALDPEHAGHAAGAFGTYYQHN